MNPRRVLPLLSLLVLAVLAADASDAWARARAGGSRGSRSFSAPVRPAPVLPSTPAAPSRQTSPAAPAPTPAPRPGPFGGLGGMLTGFVLGGLLGSLLFGGMGHGAGVGLLDVLLIAGGVLLLTSLFRRRRQEPRPAYASPGAAAPGGVAPDEYAAAPPGGVTPEAPEDLERGLRHIRAMDPAFDAAAVAEMAAGAFLEVQRAVTARDVGPLADRLTPEMRGTLQEQCDHLRAARQTNRMERIRIDRAEVTEAWQEGGWDFVTVLLAGSMLDYTVRDATGEIVAGSSAVPEAFEEYWTFTRPVGPRPWKLAAIQAG